MPDPSDDRTARHPFGCKHAKSARYYRLRRAVYTLVAAALSTGRLAGPPTLQCTEPVRVLGTLVAVAMLCAVPAFADDPRLDWPLRPRPAVVRSYDAPSPDWNRGHRGVDLAGTPSQRVYAVAAATVVYAGTLAGRPVVSLAHSGGLHTSYEPVRATVRVGQQLTAGTVIGELLAGHPGCPVVACLHWGAMWGPAARADYVDPLGLLASTPLRLKPLRR